MSSSSSDVVARVLKLNRVKMASSASIVFVVGLSTILVLGGINPFGRLLVSAVAFAATVVCFCLLALDWLASRDDAVRLLKSMSATSVDAVVAALRSVVAPMCLGGVLGVVLGVGILSVLGVFLAQGSDVLHVHVFDALATLAAVTGGGLFGLTCGVFCGWRDW